IVIGFNVAVDGAAQRRADSERVEIRRYDVIYTLFEEVEQALSGLLEPVYEDKVVGVAEVRQVFSVSKLGTIAGSYVREGEARRGALCRVLRKHQTVHSGKVTSLKRFKDDVREVRAGFECGVGIDNYDAWEEGDVIQFLERVRVR
ncbi:MAG: translation initiation factor IF-2, partial [Chloroflexi bacterium]|nr:translation initiation factor IF-2 [Chloroflexota bacterium]